MDERDEQDLINSESDSTVTKRKPKKPKKWEAFKGKFPKYEDNLNFSFNEAVADVKNRLVEFNNSELGSKLEELSDEKKILEEKIKDLNIDIEAMQQILAERFEANEMQSMTLKSGTTFFMNEEPYSKVVDAKALNDWLVENGMDEMRSIQWNKLNALVKDYLIAGQPVPPGVDLFMKSGIRMRRG